MHAEQRRRARRDRRLVVRGTRAVGRAHLHHPGAREPHHVRHPERAADLDQLPARDNDLFAFAKRGQGEEHRGGVVVDRKRGLAAEQSLQQVRHQRSALAPSAAGEVQLEVAVPRRDRQRFHGRLGERGAAEVGVQDHARRVDDAPQAWGDAGREPRGYRRLAVVIVRAVALGRDLLSDRVDDTLPPVLLHELGVARLVDQRAYSRQGCSPVSPGSAYPMHVPIESRLAGWKNGVNT